MELLHPPENCNVNSSLPFTLQICQVEDIIVEGLIKGSVIHFYWVGTVVIYCSGMINVSTVRMDTIITITLRVMLHMEVLIGLVNLVTEVEMSIYRVRL